MHLVYRACPLANAATLGRLLPWTARPIAQEPCMFTFRSVIIVILVVIIMHAYCRTPSQHACSIISPNEVCNCKKFTSRAYGAVTCGTRDHMSTRGWPWQRPNETTSRGLLLQVSKCALLTSAPVESRGWLLRQSLISTHPARRHYRTEDRLLPC